MNPDVITLNHRITGLLMQNLTAHSIHAVILAGMVAGSWVLPRNWGLLGLFAAHFCGVIGMILISYTSIQYGIGPDYESLEIFGCVLFGIAFNILMLPLSITATSRWNPVTEHDSARTGAETSEDRAVRQEDA